MKWEVSAINCLSSAVACVLCKPLGRVLMAAHFIEQRKGAEGRDDWVPSSLVTFCGASNRKSLADKAKTNAAME